MIVALSQQPYLPENFFEKPFYAPFSHKQLDDLKAQCKSTPPSAEHQVEQKLIALYEKILKKQSEVMDSLFYNPIENFSRVLNTRADILNAALTKMNTQIKHLEKRKQNPRFFDNTENAEIKIRQLTDLRDKLELIHDEYKQNLTLGEPALRSINPFLYLKTTEDHIHSAFKAAREDYSAKAKEHNNPIMKFLDALYRTITFGFYHISTQTECVIREADSSINNRF